MFVVSDKLCFLNFEPKAFMRLDFMGHDVGDFCAEFCGKSKVWVRVIYQTEVPLRLLFLRGHRQESGLTIFFFSKKPLLVPDEGQIKSTYKTCRSLHALCCLSPRQVKSHRKEQMNRANRTARSGSFLLLGQLHEP